PPGADTRKTLAALPGAPKVDAAPKQLPAPVPTPPPEAAPTPAPVAPAPSTTEGGSRLGWARELRLARDMASFLEEVDGPGGPGHGRARGAPSPPAPPGGRAAPRRRIARR
ncbi:unnamed protein product, partial [Prorocentrum cordatum]